MCLSAQVSFAASVFLVGGGTAISIVAWRRNKRYLPLALMPLFADCSSLPRVLYGSA